MKEEMFYKKVGVEVKPEYNDIYCVDIIRKDIDKKPFISTVLFDNVWLIPDHVEITHWLQPITLHEISPGVWVEDLDKWNELENKIKNNY